MNYQQSRAYIQDAAKYPIALGLTNIQELMKRLGNPQDQLKYVHVAGTNGKGSVIAYLYTTLMEAGYQSGKIYFPFCLYLPGQDGSFREYGKQGTVCRVCVRGCCSH